MPKFKITLEYNGSKFHGWQYQPNVPTIMGKLMDAIREVFGTKDFVLYGSSRTDSGVHALEQVAHLQIDSAMPPHVVLVRLNEKLPASINILSVTKVDKKFHARYDATARSYVYHISRRRTAFGKDFCWWVKDSLDVSKMQKAAHCLVGMHNFESFGQPEKAGESTLVNLQAVNIHTFGDSILIHIVGSHFLWKMVRRIVGTLVEVGRGTITAEDVTRFLKQNSDFPAQHTAPPSGLFLEKVYYPGEKIRLTPRYLINIARE